MQNYLLSSLHVICFKVHSITRDSSISDMLPCFSDEYPKSYTVRIDLSGRKTWVAALHCVSITEGSIQHKCTNSDGSHYTGVNITRLYVIRDQEQNTVGVIQTLKIHRLAL